jgi:GLPGLI family protein
MKLLIAAVLFSFPLVTLAQQGTVLYEERVKLEIDLPPEMQHMRDRIPSERIVERRLSFDGATSLMRSVPQPQEATQLEGESRGMRFRMMAASADDETYTNHDQNVQIEKRDFLERTFLIADEPLQIAWRLTDERAEFLGFLSQKAVATMENGTAVEAWFTPEIRVPVGPGRYGGLPGLILLVSENEGRRSFVAKEVSLDALADGIEAPTRGRQVTREAFDTLVEERMREMGMERRGGGGVVRFRSGN